MTEQPTLFAEPTARLSDPETSHNAAASARMRAGSQRARLLMAFAVGHQPGDDGWTAWEVGHLTELAAKPGCSYWTRVSELARSGFIEHTGQTRTVETGEDQRCYRITPQGLEALAAMT